LLGYAVCQGHSYDLQLDDRPKAEEDKKQLSELYTKGLSVRGIATKLGRTERAIKGRAFIIGIHRPKGLYPGKIRPAWEAENIKVMQESTSPRGEGGSSFKRGTKGVRCKNMNEYKL